VAKAPNECWPTDLCRIWIGRDGWVALALVLDCTCGSYWVGTSRAVASRALHPAHWSNALFARFGTLGKVSEPLLLRSDNGLVFTGWDYTALVRGYELRQEFITPISRSKTSSER